MKYSKRQAQKHKRKLSKFSKLVLPFFLLILIGLVSYLLINKFDYLNIKSIEVEGAKTFVSKTDIEELAGSQVLGKNIMSANISALRRSLLETFQGAKDIILTRKFPSKIKIFIVERSPLAVISNKSEYQYLVDGEGYILGQVEPGTTNLPEVRYEGDIAVGLFLDSDSVAAYFDVLKALNEEKLFASSVSAQSDYLSLYVKDGVEVLIGANKNVIDVVSTLTALLDQLSAEGKNVKRVDLRYDKVIVSYR